MSFRPGKELGKANQEVFCDTLLALGSTHHATHDLAVLRALNNMTIMVPADNLESAEAVKAAARMSHPVYLRFGKRPMYHLHEPGTHFEVDARRAAMARENFKRAGVDTAFTLVEGDAHENVTKTNEPMDLLFIDADKEGYIDYLNKLLPLMRPGGLIVGHNINRAQADPRYIEAITQNPALESLLVHGQVSITLKKRYGFDRVWDQSLPAFWIRGERSQEI